MDFSAYISTPKNTTSAAPKITTLILTRGRLNGGFLFFPSGPAGLLHVLAKVGGHQILPFNPGESFRLDDCTISFSMGIDMLEPPFDIDIITWNDSNNYAHSLTICFYLTPSRIKKPFIKTIKDAFSSTDGYQKS
ncbi:hypothetical protein LCGC14_0823710 [marine sediment metagenome]|uniref:Uncharacterized protein n=1 Tax=marine sediment metagenome TaxID=412755 RepID=A0A0F9SQK9_9ZZZZ|nr:hypothetical protein [Desulfobacterales bacterium]